MPTVHVCARSGCPTLVRTNEPRCPACTPKQQDNREPASQRGYGKRWNAISAAFITRHRICIDCGARSQQADHDPYTRRELVAMGVTNPDADEHLKPRCTRCHSRKTATQDGGFGNPTPRR